MPEKKKRSLKKYLILSYVIIATIFTLILTILSYISTKKMITTQINDTVDKICVTGKNSVNNFLYDVENITCLIFSNSEAVLYKSKEENMNTYEKIQIEDNISKYLLSISMYKNFSDFCIIYSDDSIVGKLTETTANIYRGESLYKKLEDKIATTKTDCKWYTGAYGSYKRMYYTKRLNSNAVILVSFFSEELDRTFKYTDSLEKMSAMLIDEENVIIYSTNKDELGKEISNKIKKGIKNNNGSTYIYDDELMSVHRCDNGWILINESPVSETFKMFQNLRIFFIVFSIIGEILAISFGVVSAFNITRPIKRIINKLKMVEKGNLDIEVNERYTMEFSEFSDGINLMVAAIKKNIEEVNDANKAKTDFLANMSHDIRTPMNAVSGFANMILKRNIDDKTKEYAINIKAASKNIIGLINNILDITKIESGKFELVCVEFYTESVFKDVISIITIPINEKGLELKINIDENFPGKLIGDDLRIKHILINILNNAVKFTEEGYIEFDATFNVDEENKDYIWARFSITDTGIGIKKENIEKMFEEFEQVDKGRNRKIEGTGLGLSISKSFVKIMGGNITVNSEYTKGTTFVIEIPLKVSDWENISKRPEEEYNKKTEKKVDNFFAPTARILVVDDNDVNMRVAEAFFEQFGIKIFSAYSGKQAINMMLTKERYDMIFMDHMMPDMDGVETTKFIRKMESEDNYYKNVPIIALTANVGKNIKNEFVAAGMNDFLGKPMDLEKLMEILKKWLNKERIEESMDIDTAEVKGTKIFEEKLNSNIIDVQKGIEYCGGSYIDWKNVSHIFIKDSEEYIKNLIMYNSKNDYENCKIIVHSIKSSAQILGAMELSNYAKRLEENYINEKYSKCKTTLMEFIRDYEEVVKETKKLEDIYKECINDIKKEKINMTDEDILLNLKKLEEELELAISSEADKILEEMTKVNFNNEEIDKYIKEIVNAVENFDREEALEYVRKIIKML